MPYVGFSHGTAQSSGALKLTTALPGTIATTLSLIPGYAGVIPGLTVASRQRSTCHRFPGTVSGRCTPTDLLLSPEALAPAALCCHGHLRLPASSASLLLSVPLPAIQTVIGPVLGIPGSSCLSSTPSGLSPLNYPELPPSTSAGSLLRALPSSFRTNTGHRVGEGNPWHSKTQQPTPRWGGFRRLVRSLSLRPFWLLAS